jgi:hypothetical protein
MADIFLSYARRDLALADPVRLRLEALGLEVFFDIEGGIDSGDTFPQAIGDAVTDAKVVVACWSPITMTRPWCRRECFMAQQQGKLVPIVVAPVRPVDLKEFVDTSYENVVDYDGVTPHFGWSQALASIARKLDNWALENPDAAVLEATLALAVKVRAAAAAARPRAGAPSAIGQTGAASVWGKVDRDDPTDLLAFAESFPNSAEAFEARRRMEHLRREDAAYAGLDLLSLKALDGFLKDWPDTRRRDDLLARSEKLRAAEQDADKQRRLRRAAKERAEKLEHEAAQEAARKQAAAQREQAAAQEALKAARLAEAAERDAEIQQKWGWLLAIGAIIFGWVGWFFENVAGVTVFYFGALSLWDRYAGGTPNERDVHLIRDFFAQIHIGDMTGLLDIFMNWALMPLVGSVSYLVLGWDRAAPLNIGFILIMITVVKEAWDEYTGFFQKLFGFIFTYLLAITLGLRFVAWGLGKWGG